MSDCTDIRTQTSCVHVCNELIKNAEQHVVKAHGYKAPEFFWYYQVGYRQIRGLGVAGTRRRF